MIRSVLDTNVIVGAFLSKKPGGPNEEIINRLQNEEFVSVYSDDVMVEYVELLRRNGVADAIIKKFLKSLTPLTKRRTWFEG